MKGVLIIGGGTTGISAARTLSRFGIHSTLVDKGPCVGGTANELACKGSTECVKCDVCLSTDKIDMVAQDRMVNVVTGAKVDLLERDMGKYRLTFAIQPRSIDDERCDRCGRCADACQSGAVLRYTTRKDVVFRIDRERCRHDSTDCQECLDSCARSALDLDLDEGSWQVEADAIIVATGATPFDPSLDPRLGHGRIPGVITSLEAERMLGRSGSLPGTPGGRKIAFIQCVGSRDPHIGAQLCSKVCCKYAMKLAKQAISSERDSKVTFFFMDWRPTDRQDDLLAWAKKEPRVKALRSRPSEIMEGADGRPVIRYAEPGDVSVAEEDFDLVVLSIGMRPDQNNVILADMLAAKLNAHGFFFGEGKMVRALEGKGIFFAGACTGPKDIEECSMEGAVAAMKAARYLEAER